MTPVGRTLRVFGIYLLVVALVLLVVPNLLLSLLALPTTEEPWIRILGLVVLVLGYYYVRTASDDAPSFVDATVIARFFAASGLIVIAVVWGYWAVTLFAIPDTAGAIWTWSTSRRAVDGVLGPSTG